MIRIVTKSKESEMKKWEKILWVFFMLVILAVFWYSLRVATGNVNRRFGKEGLVTESIDIGRVSRED